MGMPVRNQANMYPSRKLEARITGRNVTSRSICSDSRYQENAGEKEGNIIAIIITVQYSKKARKVRPIGPY
ncbi:hypothetical protein KSD_67180 [Ktedonobacter sp. SOSP1-85]|nr:hypothetical protein KSD_67180 [Ktedonobacter sp. SOSP1-85]